MLTITRKPIVKQEVECCLEVYKQHGMERLISEFSQRLLSKKVKFPLLEYAATILYENLSEARHISFCNRIQLLNTEGGNVILGFILQKRLSGHFEESIAKATEYISKAHIWYICDIIGERVFGYSLLTEPDKTIPHIQRLSKETNHWVVRSLGAGVHYAIKKGLDNEHVKRIFRILLTQANAKDKEIRQGIGWAAKTTAKFHPDIITHYKNEIENTENVANWFRTKIRIGLERNAYAKRNRS